MSTLKYNVASQWRIKIAGEQIAPIYATRPQVEVVLLVGSAARGLGDAYSDIDVLVYWNDALDSARCLALAQQIIGEVVWSADTSDEPKTDTALQSWSEAIYVGGDRKSGLKIDLTHKTVASVEKLIRDVTHDHDTHEIKLGSLYSLKRAFALYGADKLVEWQQRIGSCPLEISRLWIQKHLDFPAIWTVEMLLQRRDWLMLHQLLGDFAHRIVSIIVGLNHIYPQLRYKHLEYIIQEMAIKPEDLYQRLQLLLATPSDKTIALLLQLVDDVFALVGTHMPQIDSQHAYDEFHYRRARWDISQI